MNNNIGIEFSANQGLTTSNLFSIFNLINRTLPLQNNDILNRSFNDQGGASHPTDEKVIENLKEIEFEEDSEISCGICLESFKKGDKALLLPCKDNKHYFHLGEDKESCEGILPWLKENNTCPICRETFKEKDIISEEVVENNETQENDSFHDTIEQYLENLMQDENEENSDEENSDEENNNISEFLDELNEYSIDNENDNEDDTRINNSAEDIINLITNSIMNDFNERRNIINRRPFINIVMNPSLMNPPTRIYDEEHELQMAIQRSMEER